MQLSVKNVDEKVFREFKAKAVQNKMKVGSALTFAMQFWIREKSTKNKKSFLDHKPTSWGKGTENLSQEIDKILY